MSPIENQVDWTAATTPQDELMARSLARPKPQPAAARPKRNVMDTLLGENDLKTYDTGGADPYNATGKRVRR
jgi:hypothetical protein